MKNVAIVGYGKHVKNYVAALESVEHVSLPILGVQFHPERMAFAKARTDTADGGRIFEWFRSQI